MAAAGAAPLGRRPSQKVVAGDLAFLDELRRTGASWEQIAALLRSEGLLSRVGRPIPASVLRAMFSRASRNRVTESAGAGTPEKPAAPAIEAGKREATQNNWYRPESGRDNLAERLARAMQLRGPLEEGD